MNNTIVDTHRYDVQVQGLCKSFGSNRVLYNVALNVASGQVIVIMGPSGSGKSTLLRSLNFLVTPDSGTINIAGTCVNIMPSEAMGRKKRRAIRAIRRSTAMVF